MGVGKTATAWRAADMLDARRGLYRCDDCRATYHADTFALLPREHGGRCVACRGRSLRPLAHAGGRWSPD